MYDIAYERGTNTWGVISLNDINSFCQWRRRFINFKHLYTVYPSSSLGCIELVFQFVIYLDFVFYLKWLLWNMLLRFLYNYNCCMCNFYFFPLHFYFWYFPFIWFNFSHEKVIGALESALLWLVMYKHHMVEVDMIKFFLLVNNTKLWLFQQQKFESDFILNVNRL